MKAGWTLVEPCCGSAALTLHLLGARDQLTPYQGTKWPLRHQLQALLVRLGYWGAPSYVLLSDASPWAVAMQTVLRRPQDVADALAPLVAEGERDPEAVYARLQGGRLPRCPVRMAAELLWLQRMAFSGKAVGSKHARWKSPGFNVSSARGEPASDGFGEIRPLGQCLLRRVAALRPFPAVDGLVGLWTPEQLREVGERVVVLLDPPYQGTTTYPCGHLTRDEVLELAQGYHAAGATVIVCEAEPLPLAGWRTECLTESVGRGESSFRSRRAGKNAEWVTYRAAQAAVRAA
jgi:site-specific DNA-adenine methylase